LPPQQQSESSAEAGCDIPNSDVAKPDCATEPAPEVASSNINGEPTAAVSQSGTTETPSEPAP